MSAESRKFLWVALSIGLFVLVILAAALFLFAPQKGGDKALDLSSQAVPKAANPQDYLSVSSDTTLYTQTTTRSGDIIIVYGDKPDLGAGAPASTTPPSAPATPAAASASTPPPSAPATPAAQTTPSTVRPVVTTVRPVTTTLRPAAQAAPSAASGAVTAKASAPAAGATWIQAGAFQSRASADKLKSQLQGFGIAATVTTKEISGKTHYQVKAGPYANRDEAKKWLSTVKTVPGVAESAFITN